MKLFKKTVEQHQVFVGRVKFVHENKLHTGRIFGSPVPSVSCYYYHIEDKGEMYFVPEWSIEQL